MPKLFVPLNFSSSNSAFIMIVLEDVEDFVSPLVPIVVSRNLEVEYPDIILTNVSLVQISNVLNLPKSNEANLDSLIPLVANYLEL